MRNAENIKNECNKAKEILINKMYELLESGDKKSANELEKIIIKLEIWQNK